MRRSLAVWLLSLTIGVAFGQTPTIASVVNSASNLVAGLPNAGIAQGALMTIFGAGLGPSTLVAASAYPLSTSLAGTSVKITISGKSIEAILYYSFATQVAAILPSTTPVGTGTLTVTYGNATSAAFPITVVQNNVGLYTINSAGTGGAVVTFPDYSYVTPANAANPGEILILWANGLGPVDADDSQRPISADMTNVPLEVFIGGKPAKVLFRGRNSCCSSLDQINVQVPEGIAGCVTPIAIKIGTLVSNTATIPLAASGRICKVSNPAITDADFQTLISKSQATIGQVALLRSNTLSPGAGNTFATRVADAGSAYFYKPAVTYPYALAQSIDLPPTGSCRMSITSTASPAAAAPPVLDAGSAITISGPNGVRTYTRDQGAPIYTGVLGTGTPGNYLDPGTYTVSGPGGTSVGSFQASITFPKTLVWTNQNSSMAVNRASGVTVNWTGGDPSGIVQISGQTSAAGTANSTVFARFDCAAKVSDGIFTVPPFVLLSLPPTGATLGTLTIGDQYSRLPFKASGIDFGFVYFGSAGLNLEIVTYR